MATDRERTGRSAGSAALSVLTGALIAGSAMAQTTEDLTTGLTPEDLARALTGPGVQVLEVRYVGDDQQAGLFGEASFLLEFDAGVLLSTGAIANVVGPNSRDNMSTNFGLPGDADLEVLARFPTYDAAYLEMDVLPLGDEITIRYVFGSEEYNEYVYEDVNDAMALFVNGVNCALIDDDAVSIDTINGGNPYGTRARNAGLFNNNDLQDGGPRFNTEMDGFTRTLTCTAPVDAGERNTLKLGLADAGDAVWDSWLFIEAGSLTAQPPSIGLAKSAAVDGRQVTIDFTVENKAAFDLRDVQIVDDLDATFGAGNYTVIAAPEIISDPGGGLLANFVFDGSGDQNILAPGSVLAGDSADQAVIRIVVEVDSSATFMNTAIATATPPTGIEDQVMDLSTQGDQPDADGDGDPGNDSEPTAITTEAPMLGLAKRADASGGGPYDVQLIFTLENLGDVDLTSLSLIDDLDQVFGAGNFVVSPPTILEDPGGGLVVNPSFDGDGDTEILDPSSILSSTAPADRAVVAVDVQVLRPGRYSNQARARGVAPAGSEAADLSTQGDRSDADGDGDPGNDSQPTIIDLETPILGVAKTALVEGDGPYVVTLDFVLENSGDVDLTQVQLRDDLAETFGQGSFSMLSGPQIVSDPGGLLVLAADYDGDAQPEILDPASSLTSAEASNRATIRLVVEVEAAGIYFNQATGRALAPSGLEVSDLSQRGQSPDPDGNGDPGDNSEPTEITAERPSIGLSKSATADGSGPYQVELSFVIENYGDVDLVEVQLEDDFDQAFGVGNHSVTSSPRIISDPGGGLLVNSGFDGSGDTNLLAPGSTLSSSEGQRRAEIAVSLTVYPPGRYMNRASAVGLSPGGTLVSDMSINGDDPDPDGDGDPGNNTGGTPVPPEDPIIGLAKVADVVGTGPYRITFDFTLENYGQSFLSNVMLNDDLDARFGRGNYRIESAPEIITDPGAGLNVNTAFDGSLDKEILAPGSSLGLTPPNHQARIRLVVLLLSGGKYTNTATASGEPPSGVDSRVIDVSTDGLDPDPDGVDGPGNNSDPTVIDLTAGGRIRTTVLASKNEVSIGDVLHYQVQLDNTGEDLFDGLDVHADLPQGFSLVDEAARIRRPGADGLFGTQDDLLTPLVATSLRDPVWSGIDLEADSGLRIEYTARVGVTAIEGPAIVRVKPWFTGIPIGSEGRAIVEVAEDPIFERSLVIGKVFHDRDGDGYQDSARASGIVLKSDERGIDASTLTIARARTDALAVADAEVRGDLRKGLRLGTLKGRRSEADPLRDHRIVLRVALTGESRPAIEVTTEEGTVVRMASDGSVDSEHRGRMARGESAQDLRLDSRIERDGDSAILVIELTQHGLDETGIPGVRVATTDGLITETDYEGRFHIADLDGGRFDRGRNLLVKVDSKTLPKGHRFSTRNPRVIRLTQGMLARANFGVILPDQGAPSRTVRISLGEVLFKDGTSEISEEGYLSLDRAAETMRQFECGDLTLAGYGELYLADDSSRRLAGDRTAVVRDELVERMEKTEPSPFPICLKTRSETSLDGPWIIDPDRLITEHVICPEPNSSRATSFTGRVFAEPRAAALGRPKAGPVGTLAARDGGEGVGGVQPWDEAGDPRSWTFVEPQCDDPRGYDLQTIHHDGANQRAGSRDPPLPEEVRRVEMSAKYRLNLPGGGVVWATEDPSAVEAKLDIAAPARTIVRDGKLTRPLLFTVSTNYRNFIDRWRLSIYRKEDVDFLQPLGVVEGRGLTRGTRIEWAGAGVDEKVLLAGRSLIYQLEVQDEAGNKDLTYPREIFLIDEAETARSRRLNQVADLAILPEYRGLSGYDRSGLMQQTIPVRGSRVRVHGRDIGEDFRVSVAGEPIPTDRRGRFATEQILPVGKHRLDVTVEDPGGGLWHKELPVEISGKYFFMVGMIDITAGSGQETSIEALSGDEHYNDEIYTDGRAAFYLKGRIKGRYLLTAQLDTSESSLEDVLGNLGDKDPRRAFRNLDPDRFYPVYGDDSTTILDTQTQGRFYVRLEWDRSRVVWGNFNTGFTVGEFTRYDRSLYGANLLHQSEQTTRYGDAKTHVQAFVSEAQSAFAHDEFRSTGGSLYYLKASGIVEGSEKIWMEVRDRYTGRVTRTQVLVRGIDYEMDEIQGRILLARPLPMVMDPLGVSLIEDRPLDGDPVYLLVDYEYLPSNFKSEDTSYGVRGKQWIGDHLAIGATRIEESRDGRSHTLQGADLAVRLGRETLLEAEWVRTQAQQARRSFLSDDGGLTFSELDTWTAGEEIEGDALRLEARVNLLELSGGKTDAQLRASWRRRDAGFSVARGEGGFDRSDMDFDGRWRVNEALNFGGYFVSSERSLDGAGGRRDERFGVQGGYELNSKWNFLAELAARRASTSDSNDEAATLAALRVAYKVAENVVAYALQQLSLGGDETGGRDDRTKAGVDIALGEKMRARAELSTGDRGAAAQVDIDLAAHRAVKLRARGNVGDRGESARAGADIKLSESHTLYGTYTLNVDRRNQGSRVLSVGQKVHLDQRTRIFSENQFTDAPIQSSTAAVYGLEFQPDQYWNLGVSRQGSKLQSRVRGPVKRDAISVWASYGRGRSRVSSKVEYRRDQASSEDLTQWVSSNRIDVKLGSAVSLLAKLNLARSDNESSGQPVARFAESSLGLAYRPIHNDRWNFIGKYTYLYDLPGPQQITDAPSSALRADERSHVFSLDTIFQMTRRWSLTLKGASKSGEVRVERNSGPWIESDAKLAALRVSCRISNAWDGLVEYRWLNSNTGQDERSGALLAVYRDLGAQVSAGVGYNFTRFSDDLLQTNEDASGWFINLRSVF